MRLRPGRLQQLSIFFSEYKSVFVDQNVIIIVPAERDIGNISFYEGTRI